MINCGHLVTISEETRHILSNNIPTRVLSFNEDCPTPPTLQLPLPTGLGILSHASPNGTRHSFTCLSHWDSAFFHMPLPTGLGILSHASPNGTRHFSHASPNGTRHSFTCLSQRDSAFFHMPLPLGLDILSHTSPTGTRHSSHASPTGTRTRHLIYNVQGPTPT
ncbi:hypothetical protein Adt_01370 [Abeliophyllum distichum]|uniref:Uncharacterized protein n=1 Tax=Abeliophyllum distichum TaxID=126358 RepID=A0ABD1VSU4_9LAMI